jgi:hypothetical protein
VLDAVLNPAAGNASPTTFITPVESALVEQTPSRGPFIHHPDRAGTRGNPNQEQDMTLLDAILAALGLDPSWGSSWGDSD